MFTFASCLHLWMILLGSLVCLRFGFYIWLHNAVNKVLEQTLYIELTWKGGREVETLPAFLDCPCEDTALDRGHKNSGTEVCPTSTCIHTHMHTRAHARTHTHLLSIWGVIVQKGVFVFNIFAGNFCWYYDKQHTTGL